MNTRKYLAVLVTSAALLVLVALLSFSPSALVTAAPKAAVTPVAGVVHSGVRGDTVEFWVTEVITADGCSALLNVADHAKIDLQWVIDQGTTNTTTFTTRWTNTGSTANLVTDATVVSANTADATAGGQFALFGRQVCIYADVANSNELTVTFIGVAK